MKADPQLIHLVVEQLNNLLSRSMPTGNFDTIRGAGGDVDHRFEFWVIESGNGLTSSELVGV
jgi:hypothetical protein